MLNSVGLVSSALILTLLAKCGGSAPVAHPTAQAVKPCEQSGVGYSPVGRIVRMDDVLLKDRRDYGSHVLVDASDNLQFVLKSTNLNLDSYAGGKKWYRVYGQRAEDHPDLFVVCAVSPEP